MAGYAALPVEDPCHEAGTTSARLKLAASWDSGFCQLARRCVLETCVLAFLYAIFAFCFSFRSAPHQPVGYSQLPEDLRHSFEEVKTFAPNPEFTGYTNSSAAAWESLMPKGRGFILVDDPTSKGLPRGIPVTATGDRFALSAFHQLHCLATIREAYHHATSGMMKLANGDAGGPAQASENAHGAHQDADHLDHCFDYVRQAILCAADPALEPARVEEDGSRRDVDGWGAEHQCRSWDNLMRFAVVNRAYDREGILNTGSPSVRS